MARRNIGKKASGNKSPTGTEPPKSPDTEGTEGMTSLPEAASGEMPETSDQPGRLPEMGSGVTDPESEQSGDTPDAATDSFSDSKDPAIDAPLADPVAQPRPDADQPLAGDVPATEPADTLDDPALAKDQSAFDAATGPGGTAEPGASDPYLSEPAGATLRDSDQRLASDLPEAETIDTPEDPAKTADTAETQLGIETDGAKGPPESADPDVTQPKDMAEPVGDAGSAPDMRAQDSGTAPAQDPAAQASGDPVAPAAALASPPPPPPAPKRSIFPLLLGGLLAGGIGFGAQTLLDQSAPAGPNIAALEAEIADLRAALAAQPAPADLSPLEAELAALRDQITNLPAPDAVAASDDLNAAVDQLRADFAQAEGIDLSSLEAQIQGLSDTLADQQTTLDSTDTRMTDLQTLLDDTDARLNAVQADLDDLRDLAERRVVEAEAAIDTARAQSGLDSLRAALETGAPYRDAVTRLTDAGVPVPEALARPADSGIATLEALQDSFDDAARSALRVSLQDAPTESTTDRLGNFLRAQVGARSTVPRPGDDPDAVLSRATAAMEAGDLTGALAEIEALPEPAQAAMGEWLSAARARVAAQAALPDLTTAITTE